MDLVRLQSWLGTLDIGARLLTPSIPSSHQPSPKAPIWKIDPLAGDGSTRQFFRVSCASNKGNTPSFILLEDSAWNLSKDYAPHQEFLKSCHLPVPEFLAVDPKAGLLLMQDLGDELLQFHFRNHPNEKLKWLEQAVILIADLHGKTFPVPASLPVATRAFDQAKYVEELKFTLTHLHEKFLGLSGHNADLGLEKFCALISNFGPLVFCHRDYHCRNLLYYQNQLYLIDFQDARMGPPQYDLASILFDAYVPISEVERAGLIKKYQTQLQKYGVGRAVDWKNFEAALYSVALQRVLKAAGSFASFFTRYGKTTHLGYLKPALSLAQELLLKVKPPAEFQKLFPLDHWQSLVENRIKERLC